MKNLLRVTATMLILSMLLQMLVVAAEPDGASKSDLRGVWVSTVVNIDYPSKPNADAEALKSEAIKILDNAKAMGLNAIFLQVRPTSDAIYNSKLFPWSKYLTGGQGIAPTGGFDPLAFWITEAHNRGMELHAWLNPYRVTKKEAKDKAHDFDSLHPSNPAKLHPEWVVKHSDGNLYYNPGLPEVRQLVIDGILEIINNYDVDGIHFDDYFYPGSNFADQEAFKKYGAGYTDIHNWRRANVDALVNDLYKAIKAVNKEVSFGISPFGIWANKSTNPLGSDTKGNQSFYNHYADTRKWVKEGWLDYIAPQLYWNVGYSVADYSKLTAWWEDVVKNTNVKLYIGQAAYKSNNGTLSSPWYGVGEIEKQLRLNAKSTEIDGSIFFSYKSFVDRPSLAAVVKGFYEQKDGIVANKPVEVARPSTGLKTSLTQFYITGSSDPSKPLLLNGKPVDGRSSSGYFGILVPLQKGQNILTFAQEGSYVTRSIFREVAAAAAPVAMKTAEIPVSSVFPQVQELRSPGEKITLVCTAPKGSLVTVKIGGENYNMQPAKIVPAEKVPYPDKYTYVYTVPNFEGAPRVVDLGTPEYTMYYGGKAKTTKAPASVGVIMNKAPYYAQVNKTLINTYQTPTTVNGAAYELTGGMVDSVTAVAGTYVRLSWGQWVNKSDVNLYSAAQPISQAVSKFEYIAGEKWDELKFDMKDSVAAIADFDGKNIKLSISNTSPDAIVALPENSLFESAAIAKTGNNAEYTFVLKQNQPIEGYYVQKTITGISLYVKRPVRLQNSASPLTGLTIMLDPGHGGSDPGAAGPLGGKYPEKTINLKTALKLQRELEMLGAKVLMTRTADVAVSLDERLTASRNARPDMFLSIHANSMGDNVDISKVEGFSVFYREHFAQPAAAKVFNNTIQSLTRGNKGLHKRNLYVTRGTWTPSVLIESGFVPNPKEFEWLIDENEQTRLAKSLAASILEYFTVK